jgi:predicted site-specific integrase-resolvase
MKGWTKIKAASAYAGISPRTMRRWLKQGLRHARLPSGTILIQYSAIDEFLANYEAQDNEVDQLVETIEKELLI